MRDDADYPDFYNVVMRRARKAHSCSECGRKIDRRELYEYVTAKWDGHVQSVKTCVHCVAVRSWAKAAHGSIVHSYLREDLVDAANYTTGHERTYIALALGGMRLQWRYTHSGELMPVMGTYRKEVAA